MRRAIVALLVVLPALVFVYAAFAADIIVGCRQSHLNFDDPIVFPAQPGASHQHTYTGARNTNAFSTPASMRAAGTTCDLQRDTAGYWAPTSAAGYPVHPSKGELNYYTFNSTNGFPEGLKMIVRWSTPGNRILFKCGPGSNTETRTPPASCSSGMFVPVITFPTWWDGRLDSPDHLSHMSYSRDSTHTRQLPKLKIYWRLQVPPGQQINSNFSSGNYQSFHVDFMSSGPIR